MRRHLAVGIGAIELRVQDELPRAHLKAPELLHEELVLAWRADGPVKVHVGFDELEGVTVLSTPLKPSEGSTHRPHVLTPYLPFRDRQAYGVWLQKRT